MEVPVEIDDQRMRRWKGPKKLGLMAKKPWVVCRILSGWKMVIGMVDRLMASRLGAAGACLSAVHAALCTLLSVRRRAWRIWAAAHNVSGLVRCEQVRVFCPSDPIVACAYFSPQRAVRSVAVGSSRQTQGFSVLSCSYISRVLHLY